jgi:predicted ester cyclase
MTLAEIVQSFYTDVWNRGDLAAVPALLEPGFAFRGSLGAVRRGHEEFVEYLTAVRAALGDYRCDILDLVVEPPRAFARMRFSGVHLGPFLGFAPTGQTVDWAGAALFTVGEDGRVADLWVLGDLQALTAQLEAHARQAGTSSR